MPRRKRDATIALINVVFLMLVFFLIAGTVATPIDPELELADTASLEGREPSDALLLHKDGRLSFEGASSDPEGYMREHGSDTVRLMPDKNVPAYRLVEVASTLRRHGASSVILVTKQASE